MAELLTDTFGDSDMDDSDFEGFVFEDVQDENSLKNSESEDSVISIIIFYNIHGTTTIQTSICRYFYSLQKCNNT